MKGIPVNCSQQNIQHDNKDCKRHVTQFTKGLMELTINERSLELNAKLLLECLRAAFSFTCEDS